MSIDRAIRDARTIVTKGGFSVDVTLAIPNVVEPVTCKAITSRHHIEFDENGYPINATNSHVLFSEIDLVSLGLTVRNAKGNVALEGWLVSWIDGTGANKTYKIVQTKPSETLGLIICIVGRYGTN